MNRHPRRKISRSLRARVISVLSLAAILAAACGDADEPGGEPADDRIAQLRAGTDAAVSNLDPYHSNYGSLISSLGLEPLMKVGEDGKPEPHLAESMEQPDPTTYEYTLREGVTFWNGNELTAEDVVHSLNYLRSAGSVSAWAFGQSVKSIEAADDHTVVVKLNQPDAAWSYALTSAATGIFEKRFHDEHGEKMGAPGVLMMGTGPWKFDSLDPTRGAELSANDNYWGGDVHIDRISFKFFADEPGMALAFRSGEIDWALPKDAPAFESAAATELHTGPSANIGIFYMNTGVEPWSDIHVRRAVAHALNREDIITAFGGNATPATTLIPRDLLVPLADEAAVDDMIENLPSYENSLEEAQQEMAESGYPDGFEVTLLVRDVGNTREVSQVIASQLEQIGITAKLDVRDPAAYVANATGPLDERLARYGDANCSSPDPGQCYAWAIGSWNAVEGGWNASNYTPKEVDDLIKAGFATSDPAERFDIYTQLLERFALDVPFIPLFTQVVSVALADGLEWPGFDGFALATRGPWALGIVPANN